MDMVVRLYKYYNSLPIENLLEPKKRGRKPKTNG
jgi:hypothetical protein